MTVHGTAGAPPPEASISLWAVAALAVARRRSLALCVGFGVLCAAAVIVSRGTIYESIATVLPTSQGGPESRLEGLASQFGLGGLSDGKSGGFSLSADLILQLAGSPTLLGRVLDAKTRVNGREVLLLDVLVPPEKGTGDVAERRQEGIRALQHIVTVRRNKLSGTVSLVAATKWPAVSQSIAQALVEELNTFTFELAQAQAQAERRFIQARLADRQAALGRAEAALSTYALQNRRYETSPRLTFEYDRLQRDVTLQQQILVGLAQSSEDAAIREVRDTPALVLVEAPAVPLRPMARRRPLILLFGMMAGLALGLVGLVAVAVARSLEAAEDDDWREFRTRLSALRRRDHAQ